MGQSADRRRTRLFSGILQNVSVTSKEGEMKRRRMVRFAIVVMAYYVRETS
jgi:hypothetical protein